ncbi:MAG: ATP-dependent RecD-like DNA helicase [Lachnospirales bacterium]
MNTLTIEGIVEKVTFYNNENGYAIFTVTDIKDRDDEEMTCVGYAPSISQGESVKVTGSVVTHHFYGEQINIEICEKTEPRSERAIELYLASGVIKGIGPKIAKKIVDKFGKDTLTIMDTEPERLAELRGISREKAMSIGEMYREKTEERHALLFLGEYGISPSYAIRIYKKYKDKTIDIVRKNPYSLAEDIFGIGFKIADKIAENVGIAKDSPFRIRAGVKYILNSGANNGNVYLPIEEVIEKTTELLQIAPEIISNELTSMHIESQIWIEKAENATRVYLNFFYYAEGYVSRKLYELSSINLDSIYNYGNEIDALENVNKIRFAPQQRDAIQSAMENGVLVITGGPGTGKTTIINAIIQLCEAEGYEIELAAPTGRAAKRMEEATGHKAQTIHRLLGINFVNENSRSQTFEKDEDNPIEADVIIIDESSMIDILLMHSLLKAIPQGTRLIIVGDSNQLPSVGPGNVLRDIINSDVIKVCRLTEIFRQAQESAIITNAHKINKGEYPDLKQKDKDFFFMRRNNAQELSSLIVSLVAVRLPKYLQCDPIKDIQVLTPMRKSPLGVTALNALLQEALNPPSSNKREKEFRGIKFREGDKVMQIKNNYNVEWKIVETGKITEDGVGVFNGDEGIITYMDLDNEYVEILFDDNKVVHYDFTQMDEIDLSYAVTIHKSQGSEYKAVVMPLLNGPDMLMSRNLLYTGLTRAKQLAVIAGAENTIYRMVDNNREISRYTGLCNKLREFADFAENN